MTDQSKPWYVYIVRCRDGSLYTGISDDVQKRVEKHNSGKGTKYTAGRKPVVLVHTERCSNRRSALRRELKIKSSTRCEKLTLIAQVASMSP